MPEDAPILVVLGTGACWGVFRDRPAMEPVTSWLLWLIEPEPQAFYCSVTKSVPGRKAAMPLWKVEPVIQEFGELHLPYIELNQDATHFWQEGKVICAPYRQASALGHMTMERVRYLGASGGQIQVELVWKDDRRGLISLGRTERWLPCCATGGYNALLETLLPYYAGEAAPPMPVRELIEPELAAIAARESWCSGGDYVYLTDLRLDDPGYDGAAFAAEYRLNRLARARAK